MTQIQVLSVHEKHERMNRYLSVIIVIISSKNLSLLVLTLWDQNFVNILSLCVVLFTYHNDLFLSNHDLSIFQIGINKDVLRLPIQIHYYRRYRYLNTFWLYTLFTLEYCTYVLINVCLCTAKQAKFHLDHFWLI